MKRRKEWLIACEESGILRDAFLKLGVPAISCDLLPTRSKGPHIQADVREVMTDFYWPFVIAHPPCTDTAVSGARHFKEKRKDGRQQAAVDFFMFFANYENEKMCIEHPVSIMSTIYREPDQYIQPHDFGHGETKKTCLWLKGLPLLLPTKKVRGREQRIWKMPPGLNRARERSVTFRGIANAMAKQWS